MADSKLRKDENLDVEIKRWENESLKISVWMIRVGKEFYFFGREFASELGYVNPRKTIHDRITDPEEIKSVEDILGRDYRKILEKSLEPTEDKTFFNDFFQRLQRNQKLLTELALYQFCATSKKDKAKPFQKWIFNTIKKIRATGSYTLPDGAVDNPMNLIAKVSSLEKEVKSLREKVHTSKDQKVKTQKREKQSSKNIKTIRYNLRELRHRIKKIEDDLEELLEETDSDSSSSLRNDSESD